MFREKISLDNSNKFMLPHFIHKVFQNVYGIYVIVSSNPF
jgi:hypothetical protein